MLEGGGEGLSAFAGRAVIVELRKFVEPSMINHRW
jgi:hypothetical protein